MLAKWIRISVILTLTYLAISVTASIIAQNIVSSSENELEAVKEAIAVACVATGFAMLPLAMSRAIAIRYLCIASSRGCKSSWAIAIGDATYLAVRIVTVIVIWSSESLAQASVVSSILSTASSIAYLLVALPFYASLASLGEEPQFDRLVKGCRLGIAAALLRVLGLILKMFVLELLCLALLLMVCFELWRGSRDLEDL